MQNFTVRLVHDLNVIGCAYAPAIVRIVERFLGDNVVQFQQQLQAERVILVCFHELHGVIIVKHHPFVFGTRRSAF